MAKLKEEILTFSSTETIENPDTVEEAAIFTGVRISVKKPSFPPPTKISPFP
jgi:hypothetical protein